MARQRRLKNEINVVPYIDVMLVLLVIFMVTAPTMQTGSVDLPSVAKVPSPPVEAIQLTVKANGDLQYQKTGSEAPRRIAHDEMLTRVRDAVAANPAQTVVIAADKKVSYDKVMSTLNDLREAGVDKVSLLTQTGDSGR